MAKIFLLITKWIYMLNYLSIKHHIFFHFWYFTCKAYQIWFWFFERVLSQINDLFNYQWTLVSWTLSWKINWDKIPSKMCYWFLTRLALSSEEWKESLFYQCITLWKNKHMFKNSFCLKELKKSKWISNSSNKN